MPGDEMTFFSADNIIDTERNVTCNQGAVPLEYLHSLEPAALPIRKRGVGFRATQSSLGVFRDSKDIKDPKTPRYLQVKVNLELNL